LTKFYSLFYVAASVYTSLNKLSVWSVELQQSPQSYFHF